jgi:hypothetical protein
MKNNVLFTLFFIIPVLAVSQEVTPNNSAEIVNHNIFHDILFAVGGYILTAVVGLSVYFIQKHETNKRLSILEQQNTKLTQQLTQHYDEIIVRDGFKMNNLKGQDGLKLYEDEICDIVRQAQESIKLCLVTPLLHSLREMWGIYDANHTPEWAKLFCEPLIDTLKVRKEECQELVVEISYLEDNFMRQIVGYIPNPSIDFDEYRSSIDYFFEKLKSQCKLITFQIQEAPLYFAIVDGKTQTGNTSGVMAFINCYDLIKQAKDSATANSIANNLQSFNFKNIQIIGFFNRLFDSISFQKPDDLCKFFKMCTAYGYELGMITSSELRCMHKQPRINNNKQNQKAGLIDLANDLRPLCNKHNLVNDTKFYVKKIKQQKD